MIFPTYVFSELRASGLAFLDALDTFLKEDSRYVFALLYRSLLPIRFRLCSRRFMAHSRHNVPNSRGRGFPHRTHRPLRFRSCCHRACFVLIPRKLRAIQFRQNCRLRSFLTSYPGVRLSFGYIRFQAMQSEAGRHSGPDPHRCR